MDIRLILIVVAFLVTTNYSLGQSDPLDNFWKDVERKKSLKKKVLPDETIKYDAVILKDISPRIFIVQQDYIYEKKNKRYVKGGDEYYGRVFGVGISTPKGVVASKHLHQPWKNDKSVLQGKGYTPVLTNVEFKSVSDQVITSKEEGQYVVYSGSHFVRYPINEHQLKGRDIIQPDSTGLLMLFYLDIEKDSIWKRTSVVRIKWDKSEAEIDTQFLREQLIGGVFMNVDTTNNKQSLTLTAIMSGNDASEFRLIALNHLETTLTNSKTRNDSQSKSNTINVSKTSSSGKSKKAKQCRTKPGEE